MHLPFVEVLGNSWTYDTITTRSTASFYTVGDTWAESTPVVTQTTALLKVLGGDANIDNFLLATRANKLDLKGEVLNDRITSIKEKFMDTFYYGDDSADTKSFDGLHLLMSSTTYNTVQEATDGNGGAGSSAALQQAIDLIHGFDASHLLMAKTTRRLMNTYLDGVGSAFTAVRDEYGRIIEYFRGLKIAVDDHITITESTTDAGIYESSTDDDQTSIFVATFAPKAFCGIQGPNSVETVPLGDLETKDAQGYRIKWYCGLKFEDLRSCAKYIGILSGSAWEA